MPTHVLWYLLYLFHHALLSESRNEIRKKTGFLKEIKPLFRKMSLPSSPYLVSLFLINEDLSFYSGKSISFVCRFCIMNWDFPFPSASLLFVCLSIHANCLNVTNQPRMHENFRRF